MPLERRMSASKIMGIFELPKNIFRNKYPQVGHYHIYLRHDIRDFTANTIMKFEENKF